MEQALSIFLSTVSKEFHDCDPDCRQAFVSYREILAESLRRIRQPHTIADTGDLLRRLDPVAAPDHVAVVSKENLSQGFADLLATLDREVAAATVVIRLVGDMAGIPPPKAALRVLLQAHPALLEHEPELRVSLGDFQDITYTQWELWLAFHHRKRRLVFIAAPTAPRSPLYAPDTASRRLQKRHRRRIELTGEHLTSFRDQRDLVSQAVRALDREGLIRDPGLPDPPPEAVEAARGLLEKIVPEIVASIGKPDPKRVFLPDRAGVAAWISALDTAAAVHQLNRRVLVRLLDEVLAPLLERAEGSKDPSVHLDLAFHCLALGEYSACIDAAERAVWLAQNPIGVGSATLQPDIETILNAHGLIQQASMARHDPARAIRALQEGGACIDRQAEPCCWADHQEPLAWLLLDQAQWAAAGKLIGELIDIRESTASEQPAALAGTLLLWARFLNATGNLQGAVDVSRRAGGIFADVSPPDLQGQAAACCEQGIALQELERFAEAEKVLSAALAIDEGILGPDHPSVARDLSNLATVFHWTNRLERAESMTRRALKIGEAILGPDHPKVATYLNNLAQLLQDTNRLEEAERVMRRALDIDEANFGPDHPNIASALHNLAGMLMKANRLDEAEPLARRALTIREINFGPDHPHVAMSLMTLALVLKESDRLTEAELVMRRLWGTCERVFGERHDYTLVVMHILADVLEALGKDGECYHCRGQFLQRVREVGRAATSWNRRRAAVEFLWRRDYPLAEELLLGLVAEGYEPATTRLYLAQLYLETGQTSKARVRIAELAAADNQDGPWVLARQLWFRLALTMLESGRGAMPSNPALASLLGQLKTTLQSDEAFRKWTMDAVLDQLKMRLHEPDHALLSALVAALSDRNSLSLLDAFAAWRNALPVPVDSDTP